MNEGAYGDYQSRFTVLKDEVMSALITLNHAIASLPVLAGPYASRRILFYPTA